ncbi:DNA phosphorothioation-dependent restriction protein DptF [Neobacillus drentensis]|uniref:DNA phosphorothioation-dependent restriction protein DptF n=1 Tax=Neobacillus drentensis TaxID=220684 RepID=UPI002FFF5089
MKQEYALQFIEVFNKEWAELGKDFELLLFKDIDASLFKARKLAELLVKEVYIQEEMEYPSYANQAEKNMLLINEGIIEDNVFSALDRIRRMGNAAIHADKKIPISDAFKVHHNLFFIVKWFVESYVLSPDKEVPPYQDLQFETLDEKVKKLLEEYIPDYLKKEEQQPTEVEIGEETELPTLHNSFLLYQLSKLRESSQEAVEGYQELSNFKKYMHVKRPIQDIFEEHLQECKDSPGSKLIFLCGSVGDGKSHLLGYLSTTKPDLMNHFKIHNDATESFDPRKNSMDTLSEVLEPFSDSLIEESSEKLILAINLGVLHNFIESTYAHEKYQKLKAYIEEARVFESGVISSPAEHDTFKLVNFADYHSFELTQNGPISTYMSALFESITKEDSDNPFYVAYQKDKEKFVYNPLLINFKMFSSKSMQQQIIQLIVKTIMKDKIIISSRELLNFVHDILVPSSEELKTHDFIDMLPHLLPNLLFDGGDKSPVLKMLGNQDPIHYRTQEVDENLVSLYNSGNYYVYYRDIIFDSSAQEWIQLLEPVENIAFLDKDTKRELSELLIRASFLYDSHLKESFKDTVYENYMKFLYAYNTNNGRNLLDLYFEVEKSIYHWKGSPTNGYLYLDEEGNSIRIAEPIQIKKEMVTIENEPQEIIYRFTPTLFLGFRCAPYKQIHQVEIDLPLYEMIGKVLHGYRLNRKDRENSIQFIKFIDSLLPFGQQQEEILIKDVKTQFMFRLEYEEFFGFKFSREG